MKRLQRTRWAGRLVVLAGVAALSLLPTEGVKAAGMNVAVGNMDGVAEIANGIPKLGEPCAPRTFTMGIDAQIVVAMNTVLTGYVGPIRMDGGGGGPCDALSGGGGPITLTAKGNGPTGSTVECLSLVGTYTRVGSVIQATVSGDCVVNNFGTGRTTFLAVALFRPEQGDGINTRVTKASFRGGFVAGPI